MLISHKLTIVHLYGIIEVYLKGRVLIMKEQDFIEKQLKITEYKRWDLEDTNSKIGDRVLRTVLFKNYYEKNREELYNTYKDKIEVWAEEFKQLKYEEGFMTDYIAQAVEVWSDSHVDHLKSLVYDEELNQPNRSTLVNIVDLNLRNMAPSLRRHILENRKAFREGVDNSSSKPKQLLAREYAMQRLKAKTKYLDSIDIDKETNTESFKDDMNFFSEMIRDVVEGFENTFDYNRLLTKIKMDLSKG